MNILNNRVYNTLIDYDDTWWCNKMEQVDRYVNGTFSSESQMDRTARGITHFVTGLARSPMFRIHTAAIIPTIFGAATGGTTNYLYNEEYISGIVTGAFLGYTSVWARGIQISIEHHRQMQQRWAGLAEVGERRLAENGILILEQNGVANQANVALVQAHFDRIGEIIREQLAANGVTAVQTETDQYLKQLYREGFLELYNNRDLVIYLDEEQRDPVNGQSAMCNAEVQIYQPLANYLQLKELDEEIRCTDEPRRTELLAAQEKLQQLTAEERGCK
jgi:hypothetical protein